MLSAKRDLSSRPLGTIFRIVDMRDEISQDFPKVGVEESDNSYNILMEDLQEAPLVLSELDEQYEEEPRGDNQPPGPASRSQEASAENLLKKDEEIVEKENKTELRISDISDRPLPKSPHLQTPLINRNAVLEQLHLQQDILRQMGLGPGAQMARQSNMFLALEPPEGMSPDELNTMEKIFYGFQKRVFENYIRSLITSYGKTKSRYPRIDQSLQGHQYRLSGRVTFDRFGNVVSIRINQWTNQKDVQELFEESLKGINKIPNIPSTLLQDRDEFNIYYILQIN